MYRSERVIFFNIDMRNCLLPVGEIRKMIVKENFQTPHCEQFWERKYNLRINKTTWLTARKVTKETRLRTLHWKILHNIYPTSILLSKMGLKNNDLCNYCLERDLIEHFFVHCNAVKPLWSEVGKIIKSWIGKDILLNESTILLGMRHTDDKVMKSYKDKINQLILIGKMCISKFKYGKRHDIICILHHECRLRKIETRAEKE